MQPKFGSEVKLYYMNADSLVYETKTEAFYKDIANDIETNFDTSRYSKDDTSYYQYEKTRRL